MLESLIIFLITITLIKGNMRRAYKFSVILYAATVSNVSIYVFLVVLLEDTWMVSKTAEFLQSLRYVLLALAGAELVFIKVFRKFMIRKGYPKDQNMKRITELLLLIELITFALCECIVIYGLLFFFLSGDSTTFYVFLVLGVFALGVYFPRYSQWEKLAKLQEAKEISTT